MYIHIYTENYTENIILKIYYYTENISSFLDYHLQPLAQKVK